MKLDAERDLEAALAARRTGLGRGDEGQDSDHAPASRDPRGGGLGARDGLADRPGEAPAASVGPGAHAGVTRDLDARPAGSEGRLDDRATSAGRPAGAADSAAPPGVPRLPPGAASGADLDDLLTPLAWFFGVIALGAFALGFVAVRRG